MKASSEAVKDSFTPFNLILTIQSEDEAVRIFALFNHTGILNIIDPTRQVAHQVRCEIESRVGHKPDYEPYYSKLNKLNL